MADDYLRVKTEDGVMQVSDARIYFSTAASGEIDNNDTGWGSTSVPNVQAINVTINGVSPSDNPMFGLTSDTVSTWAHLVSSTSTSVTYRVYRSGGSSPGSTTKWWCFTTNPPPYPSGEAAMVLRNASGQIVYSTASPVARVLGTYNQNGYTGLPTSGRTVAHVPLKMGKSSFTSYTNGGLGSCSQGTSGGPGYQRYTQTGAAYMLMDLTGSGPISDQIGYQTGIIPLNCQPSPGQEYTSSYSSLGNYSSLIIDVTHY